MIRLQYSTVILYVKESNQLSDGALSCASLLNCADVDSGLRDEMLLVMIFRFLFSVDCSKTLVCALLTSNKSTAERRPGHAILVFCVRVLVSLFLIALTSELGTKQK